MALRVWPDPQSAVPGCDGPGNPAVPASGIGLRRRKPFRFDPPADINCPVWPTRRKSVEVRRPESVLQLQRPLQSPGLNFQPTQGPEGFQTLGREFKASFQGLPGQLVLPLLQVGLAQPEGDFCAGGGNLASLLQSADGCNGFLLFGLNLPAEQVADVGVSWRLTRTSGQSSIAARIWVSAPARTAAFGVARHLEMTEWCPAAGGVFLVICLRVCGQVVRHAKFQHRPVVGIQVAVSGHFPQGPIIEKSSPADRLVRRSIK